MFLNEIVQSEENKFFAIVCLAQIKKKKRKISQPKNGSGIYYADFVHTDFDTIYLPIVYREG